MFKWLIASLLNHRHCAVGQSPSEWDLSSRGRWRLIGHSRLDHDAEGKGRAVLILVCMPLPPLTLLGENPPFRKPRFGYLVRKLAP